MPFFSIIIPTYNSEQTISRCLASVLSQKFDDFELIIIDGSSSDRTITLVRHILANKPELLYTIVSEKDKGIYDAMNKGADQANGQWLYFLGSDDEFVNNEVLSAVYKHLVTNPSPDFFYGNVLLKSTGKRYAGRFDMRRLLIVNICHQAIFVSRKTFLELGPFNTRYTLWADWDFNLKVFLHRKRVCFSSEDIAYYNDEGGESSASSDMIFGQRLQELKKEYFSNPINLFRSQLHHCKKKMSRWIAGMNL
jgi:glycosyltransferase involved in cell wall biosynthesis